MGNVLFLWIIPKSAGLLSNYSLCSAEVSILFINITLSPSNFFLQLQIKMFKNKYFLIIFVKIFFSFFGSCYEKIH